MESVQHRIQANSGAFRVQRRVGYRFLWWRWWSPWKVLEEHEVDSYDPITFDSVEEAGEFVLSQEKEIRRILEATIDF